MTNVTMLVCNRPTLTKQSLESFGNPEHASLFVLDDCSEIDLQDWLDDWCDQVSSRCVTHIAQGGSLGTGTNRNTVIRCSEEQFGRGDYLVLSDNDVVFNHGWLPTLIDCYEAAWNSGCRVVGGVGHPYHQHGETLATCGKHTVKEVMAQPLQSMLMRWDVWDRFGPFDETEPGMVCQGEDVLFTKRIQEAGYKVGVVDPALIVNTGITNSFGEKIPGWELVKAQCPEGVVCL